MTGDKPGLQGYDEEQVQMMKENCIVVDNGDNIIGHDSKVNCHLGEGRLHRAFSIVLFNSSGKLEWEFINKARNNKTYIFKWSRIIQNKKLIKNIKQKIQNSLCSN